MDIDQFDYVDGNQCGHHHHPELCLLYWPNVIPSRDWHLITTDQAAIALRSYLTIGEANWDEALK